MISQHPAKADVVSSLLAPARDASLFEGGTAPGMRWQNTPWAPVAMVSVRIDATAVSQMYGRHAYHLRVCDALGLDHVWYAAPTAHTMSHKHVPLAQGLARRNLPAFTPPRPHC